MDIIKVISHFIEAFSMTIAVSGIIGQSFKANKLFLVTTLYGLFIFCVRLVYELSGIPLGTHTLILLIIYVMLLAYVARTGLGKGFVGTMVGFILILAGEVFTAYIFQIVEINMDTVLVRPIVYTFFCLVSYVPIWLAAFLTKYYKVSIFGKVIDGQ